MAVATRPRLVSENALENALLCVLPVRLILWDCENSFTSSLVFVEKVSTPSFIVSSFCSAVPSRPQKNLDRARQ